MATPASPSGQSRSGRTDGLIAGAAAVSVLAMYWPTVARYHAVWLAEPNTHGYLVAAGTGVLLWQERAAFDDPRGWKAPIPLLALLSVAWLLAHVASVQFATLAIFPALAMAWCAAVFGSHAFRRLLPVALVFMVAVPIWGVLIPVLRRLTLAVTTATLGLMRIPAEIDGATIHLTYGSFVIEDACAGFNYFMAGFAVGALYAVGLVRTRRTRLQVLAVAAGLSLVANWIRVTSLIVIGHLTRMDAAILSDHGTYGWVVFTVFVLVAFFPIAGRLARHERNTDGDPAEVDHAEVGGQILRDAPGKRPGLGRSVGGATAAAAIGPALFLGVGTMAGPGPSTLPGPEVGATPYIVSGRMPEYGWSPAYEGDDERRRTMWEAGPRDVTVDRIIYRNQRQSEELVGLGNRIAADSLVLSTRMLGPVGEQRRIINESIVREGEGAILVWYWFRVGGIETASPLKAKLLEIPAFFGGRSVSELIAVSTPCDSESCESAAAALRDFLSG